MEGQTPEEQTTEASESASRRAPRFDVIGEDRVGVEFTIEELVRTVMPLTGSHCAGCTGCNGCRF
jgi:hypothetical protein